MTEVTHRINGALKKRVLNRLGRTQGDVDIREEEWDFGGGCTTCSFPEDGFSVYVDGEQVWPSDELLNFQGGVHFADTEGYVNGRTLTSYGQFDRWLRGEDFRDEEYDD